MENLAKIGSRKSDSIFLCIFCEHLEILYAAKH